MSVDTVTKRFSVMHLFGGFCAVPAVADSSFTVKDRMTFLNLYSGIADDETITATGYVYSRDKAHDAIAKRKRLRRGRR